jgi:hypothetical protein
MNWSDPIGRGKSGGGEKCTMGWEGDSHVVVTAGRVEVVRSNVWRLSSFLKPV